MKVRFESARKSSIKINQVLDLREKKKLAANLYTEGQQLSTSLRLPLPTNKFLKKLKLYKRNMRYLLVTDI